MQDRRLVFVAWLKRKSGQVVQRRHVENASAILALYKLLKCYAMNLIEFLAYIPQSNGLMERINKTL